MSELLDVEEDIWSPTYGLKGKLDATVQTTISHFTPKGKLAFTERVHTYGPKPLAIKTGRATAGMEHRAQTLLYTLLALERCGIDVTSGLLCYITPRAKLSKFLSAETNCGASSLVEMRWQCI